MSRTTVKRVLILAVLAVALGLGAAGCGKRAERLDPPPGSEDDRYPRTYPSS